MLRRALACVQSFKSLHCSRTSTKWAYIWQFFQSMLRRDLVSLQSCQSFHCSRKYTKWVCLWFLLSVNAQTSLSMRAASPEPPLLSHMRKMGVHTLYSFSQCSDEPKRVCSLARASTALEHAQNGRKYGIFCQSMLRRDLVCMQSSKSVHCSRTCAIWAYIRHIPSVNAQTSLSVCAVFQEPLLLSHMYKMGVHMAF